MVAMVTSPTTRVIRTAGSCAWRKRPHDHPGDPQAELGHGDVVEEEGQEYAGRNAHQSTGLPHQRAEEHQQGEQALTPGASVHPARRARQRVAHAIAGAEHHAQGQDLEREHQIGPATSEGDRDELRCEDRRDHPRRQGDEREDRGALDEGVAQPARIVLGSRHGGEQDLVEHVTQQGRRHRHQLVGSAVLPQRHGTQPAPDDEVVRLVGHDGPDAGDALPHAVVHQLDEAAPGGRGREQAGRRAQQNRRAEHDLGELGQDQCPHSPPEQSQADAHDPIPDAVRDHIAVGQQPKPQVSLEQALGDGGDARNRKYQRQRAHHRRQLLHAEESGDQRSPEPDDPRDQKTEAG